MRVLRFYPIVTPETVNYNVEEILQTDGIFFTGSGKNVANDLYNKNNMLTPLQIIKIVIENKLNDSVGGVLQHGIFKNDGNFSLSGVTEDIVSDNTGEVKRVSHFLGFELSSQKVSNEYPMLYITYGATAVDWQHPKWKE